MTLKMQGPGTAGARSCTKGGNYTQPPSEVWRHREHTEPEGGGQAGVTETQDRGYIGTMAKPNLRDRVRAMRLADPRVSATTMARMLGCTHQRVSQILNELGLPTRVHGIYDPLCETCKRPYSQHVGGQLCT